MALPAMRPERYTFIEHFFDGAAAIAPAARWVYYAFDANANRNDIGLLDEISIKAGTLDAADSVASNRRRW